MHVLFAQWFENHQKVSLKFSLKTLRYELRTFISSEANQMNVARFAHIDKTRLFESFSNIVAS